MLDFIHRDRWYIAIMVITLALLLVEPWAGVGFIFGAILGGRDADAMWTQAFREDS